VRELQGSEYPVEYSQRFFDAHVRYYRPGGAAPFSAHDETDLHYASAILAHNDAHVGSLGLRGWVNTELGFVVPIKEADACSDTAIACFNAAADFALEKGDMGRVAEYYMGITATHVYRPWSKDEPLTDKAWEAYRTALADTSDFVCGLDLETMSEHQNQKLTRIRYELVALMGLNAVRGDKRKPVKDVGVSATYRQRRYRDSSLAKDAPGQTWHVSAIQYRNSEWTDRHRIALLSGNDSTALASTLHPVSLAPVIGDQTPTGINRMLRLQVRGLRGLPLNDGDKEKVADVQRYLKQLDKKLR